MFAIIMFLIAGIILSIPPNDITVTNLFAVYAFWLLLVGMVCLAIEYKRERW
jgi:hypothetical protein